MDTSPLTPVPQGSWETGSEGSSGRRAGSRANCQDARGPGPELDPQRPAGTPLPEPTLQSRRASLRKKFPAVSLEQGSGSDSELGPPLSSGFITTEQQWGPEPNRELGRERNGGNKGRQEGGAEGAGRGAEGAGREGDGEEKVTEGAGRGAEGAGREGDGEEMGTEGAGRGAEGAGREGDGEERGTEGAGRGAEGAGREGDGEEKVTEGAGQGAEGAGGEGDGEERGAEGAGRGAEGAGRDIDGARRGAEGAGREGEGEERGAEGTGRSGLGEEAVGERGTEKRWKGLGGGGERAWRQQRGRGRRVGGSEGDRLGALTRTLQHSSASSSSSFNCSSAESDEVFSEDEEGAAKRKVLRKCRSLKTFFTMMQWSLRRQNSWVQLAGHEGNFCPSGGGEVLKRFSVTEGACLQSLMSDVLRPFVPQYRGPTTRGGQTYLRLEDLLSGLDSPVIMDCKMGVRTYLEEELTKARLKPCPRRDMYQKMVKVDPAAPTADEHAQQAVTKPRYMQWRETISSTATLGFRIEGITMEAGKVLRDFKKTRTPEQIIEAILAFTRGQTPVLEAYLSRLNDLRSALPDSVFFHSHELIGSSLLFVHDLSGRANVWMIDFGKTTPAPPSLALRHDVPWTEGSREDGYLIGLAHLTSIVGWALERSRTGPGPGSSADSDQDFRTAPEPSPVPPRPADDGTGPRPRQGHT